MAPDFIHGLDLSEQFFLQIVKPLIDGEYQDLPYAAALIGSGSEVLGYDDITSTDHHWGVRLQIFLKSEDLEKYSKNLKDFFSSSLPYEFMGYSTHWSEPDPEDAFNQFPQLITDGKINHRIAIYSVESFLRKFLDIDSVSLTQKEWLVLPEQRLLEFTSGRVFYDDLGELTETRALFEYFPSNVWFFKILSGWVHIAEEFAFVGRPGMIGDDLGSRLEASRLVRYIMQLSFILHKKYMPYPKWFSYGFKQLPIAKKLLQILISILKEDDWKERETLLGKAYSILLDVQNELNITPKIDAKPRQFFSRDQMVFEIGKITQELEKIIEEPLKALKYQIGSVDQFIDYPNILCEARFAKKAKSFFED